MTILDGPLESGHILSVTRVCSLHEQEFRLHFSKHWPNKIRGQILVMRASGITPAQVYSDLLERDITQRDIESLNVEQCDFVELNAAS